MVKTGYIAFVVESASTQDVDGNPIAASKTYSQYFPCNLNTVTKEYRTFVDGQAKQAAYSIYVDSPLVVEINIQSITEVSLKDNMGNVLGLFQIQNVEYLLLSKRVKIVV